MICRFWVSRKSVFKCDDWGRKSHLPIITFESMNNWKIILLNSFKLFMCAFYWDRYSLRSSRNFLSKPFKPQFIFRRYSPVVVVVIDVILDPSESSIELSSTIVWYSASFLMLNFLGGATGDELIELVRVKTFFVSELAKGCLIYESQPLMFLGFMRLYLKSSKRWRCGAWYGGEISAWAASLPNDDCAVSGMWDLRKKLPDL